MTAAFGEMASEITGRRVFNRSSAHTIVTTALEKAESASALGNRLWYSLVPEGQTALVLEDLEQVLGSDNRDLAKEIFDLLDKDENGDVNLQEMVGFVIDAGNNRSNIAKSIHEVDSAIQVLDNLLLFFVLAITIVIYSESRLVFNFSQSANTRQRMLSYQV